MIVEKYMKYCINCKNVFKEEELQTCICDDCFGNKVKDLRIVTKNGVKYISQDALYCKTCLELYHQHIGEAFC